jgi:hypothetical protein
MMKARWQKIENIFNQAVELPLNQRNAFVKSNCQTDSAMKEEILSLIEKDAKESDFLNENCFLIGLQLL